MPSNGHRWEGVTKVVQSVEVGRGRGKGDLPLGPPLEDSRVELMW